MKKNFIISFDLGTSGNKASIFDIEGNLISSSFKSYKTYFPFSGWSEQKQSDWERSVQESVIDLLEKAQNVKKNLAAVSFSGQMMGCCPIDSEGMPLCNAIIWSDQRSYKEKEYLKDILTDEFTYKNTGNVVCANYLASKALWLKNNHYELYKKTYKFLQAKDYIIYKLTGNIYTDYSDASGTNLFDINKKVWHEDILKAAQINKDKLPELVPSTELVGKVKKDVAEIYKLPAGLPVVIGGGDGPCATVGAGATSPNSCYNIFGSSSWTSLTTEKPLYDSKMRTFILNHLDPKLYMALGAMQSAGASYEWLNDWLGDCEKIISGNLGVSSYYLLDQLAEKSVPGSNGVIFLPYLMGERSPYWDTEVKGAFLGLTRVVKRKDIIRAVLEGILFHLKLILEILEEHKGNISEVRLLGRGAKSKILQQMMADIWRKNVTTMQYMEEATSIGAAVAAIIGIGIKKDFVDAESFIKRTETIKPDINASNKYEGYYKIFKKAYYDLKEVNSQLDKLIKL